MKLSAQERKLLQDVGAALAQAEAQPEARPDRADVAQQADAEAHLV
jgi:hypothetical protein